MFTLILKVIAVLLAIVIVVETIQMQKRTNIEVFSEAEALQIRKRIKWLILILCINMVVGFILIFLDYEASFL